MPAELDACVEKLIAQGKEKDEAFAICNKQLGAASKVEVIEDKDNGRLYLRAFLLDSSINLNDWGVDPATLEQNINSYIGKPLVLQDDFQHPDSGDPNFDHHLTYQEKFRIGNIVDIVKKDSIYSAIIEVTDNTAKEAFKKGDLPLYVSPQLFHDGVGREPDTAAKTWRGTHLAVVKEPAFGIMKARVEGQCSGSPITCLAQLKRASVDKTKCNCVKQAIKNFRGFTVGERGPERVPFSSLTVSKNIKSSLDSKDNTNNPQISQEEFEKVSRERDELKAKVAALEGTNKTLTEENKTVSASLDSLKGEYRKDKVSSLLSNVFYKTDEERGAAVEAYTKSGMTYEDIERVTSPLKKASVTEKETKLPTKSAASESNNQEEEVPYYVRIHNFIAGVNS